jgi:uncharacterized protein (DUF302 family)
MTITVERPYDETVAAVRERLAEQGFGVLTEIDVAATLRSKLGVEVLPMVILGACRPELAHRAIAAEPSIAALLPCNVVVREAGSGVTVVEAADPDAMMQFAGGGALREVAAEARQRLSAALTALSRAPALRGAE